MRVADRHRVPTANHPFTVSGKQMYDGTLVRIMLNSFNINRDAMVSNI